MPLIFNKGYPLRNTPYILLRQSSYNRSFLSAQHPLTVMNFVFLRFVDHSSFLPCQWPIHSLLKWVNSSCQWIYTIHHSLQQSTTSTIVSNDEAQYETISCLSTLIFDRLAQASTRIQIVCYLFSIVCFFINFIF
jgi:hypothetical protein